MATDYFPAARIAVFFLATFFFVAISWRPLHNPRCHGFYRFFAFEGILVLLLLNAPFWFDDRYSPRQIVSWLCLFTSLGFLAQGLYWLRRMGGSATREKEPENFSFENTAHLVTRGIYRYVRHPMYGSLLLLAWGVFLKNITLPGTFLAMAVTFFLLMTARIEERENASFFGPSYLDYQKQTKRFLPFIL